MFQKSRASFRFDKCVFLKERVEFVGHDLNADGNYPAAGKFDVIRDWILPTTGQSLHSFFGMVIFYHRYVSYLEIRIKPLRKILKTYFRKKLSQPWLGSRISWNCFRIYKFVSHHLQC